MKVKSLILSIALADAYLIITPYRSVAQEQEPIQEQFACALTEKQVAQQPEVLKRDSLVIARLRDIDPKYADRYAHTYGQERLDFIGYLVNEVCPKGTDTSLPENKKWLEYLKLYSFTTGGTNEDHELTGTVYERLKNKYGIFLRISGLSISDRSMQFNLYGMTTHEEIEAVCCFLKDVKKETGAKHIGVYFYQSTPIYQNGEIFESDIKLIVHLRIQ